jgi:hypothetical protein
MAERSFTNAENHRALIREIEFRKRVYPRQMDAGRMTSQEASRQIALFEAIAADYADLVEMERLL